uniref:Putative leucine-rich repeat resistance protein, identical n=1 Tax=Solanum demissum TaxID=50514 RepID=Q6L3Q5_SOLDE|nr:Putative leucine-rich repeat resistance protein, identical [Solanum demissum]
MTAVKALNEIKASLGWRVVYAWVGDDPCGDGDLPPWSGVTCSTQGDYRVVTELEVYAVSIVGLFPTVVTNLLDLTRLYLSFNNFKGEIPKELANLPELRYLHLHENHFIGRILAAFVLWPLKRDNTPTIAHKEGHMELWPEQQLDDTTFESEADIEWILMRVKSNLSELGVPLYSGWGKDGGNLHIELNEHGQENTDATDDMKCILMMSYGSKWKESKHEAKTIGYDPYNIDIERLAHCPDRVEEDQWRSLVHYWSSKEAKMTKKNNGVKPTRIEVLKKTHIRANKQPVNEIAGEVMKQMDDLAKVYPELNVPGSAPNDVYSQAEKRYFDSRVEKEVQKATSTMKIEMTKKMSEAKKEMEAMDKKLLEAKEEAKENNEVMERKLLEAKMDMEEIIADKVKEGIQSYVESLGINVDVNLKSEQVK